MHVDLWSPSVVLSITQPQRMRERRPSKNEPFWRSVQVRPMLVSCSSGSAAPLLGLLGTIVGMVIVLLIPKAEENLIKVVAAERTKEHIADLPRHVEGGQHHGHEPGLQGDRSTGGTKPATVETGLQIQVPLFITTGERVKVDTRDGSYLGRVN